MSYLDRDQDGAVVACLVGGDQEINDAEMGIFGWLDAIDTSFSHWTAYTSANRLETEYNAGQAVQRLNRRTAKKKRVCILPSRSAHSARSARVGVGQRPCSTARSLPEYSDQTFWYLRDWGLRVICGCLNGTQEAISPPRSTDSDRGEFRPDTNYWF